MTPSGPQPRDPRQPFGTPAQPGQGQPAAGSSPRPRQQAGPQQPHQPASDAPQIGHYAPPPRRRTWWVWPLLLALLAVLGYGALRLNGSGGDPAASTTPSSEPTSTAKATPAPTTIETALRDSVPFTNERDGSQGTFQIVDSRWTGSGLYLTVRVSLTAGSQRLGFFALDNQSATESNPSPTGANTDIDGQHLSAGQSSQGVVYFSKPKGDTTVFLTDSAGKQVAALVVKG